MSFQSVPQLKRLLKENFFAGILILIPIGVIAWISAGIIGFVWNLDRILPYSWRPTHFIESPWLAQALHFIFTFGILLILALAVSLLGLFSKLILGKKIIEFIGELIQKIPVLRSIYGALDQLLKTLATGGGKQFSRVVFIEYPKAGTWTIGFVTGSSAYTAFQNERFLNVFVPTTPNPTSGFYLIVKESEIRESGMTVEEAFKALISLGIAHPTLPKSAHGESHE